ncbi:MAG TPA: alpha-L-arabinofuranosidase C-terminal domain-containing protein [Acidobacteriaceae bacterium]|nr:alpha-L-arabinofuranosidase C-terminal domain-containing protein [Acidobacteriaceae bacterium]
MEVVRNTVRGTNHRTKTAHVAGVIAAALLAIFAATTVPAQEQPSLTVQVDHATGKVSPMLYGLMTEEINYSYDGGIYAEMVRDRAIVGPRLPLFHWTMVSDGSSSVKISVDQQTGPSKDLPRSMKVEVTQASAQAPAGVQNDGYWGMAVRPNTTYSGSFYAKTEGAEVPITVTLRNDETGARAATTTVNVSGGDWKEYTYTLKTGAVPVSSNNHLQLTTTQPATIWFDLISLFPPTYHNRPHGNRVDLMEKLAAMHPAFLRLPGGNYLEGEHIADRFDWKKTIGPWTDRPTHMSPWRYRSSDGMGLLEFLEWCEDLKMQPLLAVYAGYSLAHEHVDPGPALEPYVQDALDEIEYVTGSTDTHWGAERAKDGHPAPFPLHYVEIGNEDWFDRSGSYEGRFAQFFKAIKQRYPDLQLIATAPVKDTRPDVLDEHFYMSAEQAFADAGHYDHADRNGPKIFVGEWATREAEPTPNLEAALADSAWMTGMERNGDLVIMSSYAPLFVNVNPGGMQWPTDLIGYNALSSYGSPSYYAQVMFATHIGTEIVDAQLSTGGNRLYASVTRDNAHRKLFLKLVNGTSLPQNMKIDLKGARAVSHGRLITLSGKSPNSTNTIYQPRVVVPVEKPVAINSAQFMESLLPWSVNVLELSY